MARQNQAPSRDPNPKLRHGASPSSPDLFIDPDLDSEFALWLGERLRRLALGATAALLTARAFWPSEADFQTDAGNGLLWVFALLLVSTVAVASALIGGELRLRFSWADAAVLTLFGLVALSASNAVDRRPAINLSWEWVAFGLAYLLLRSLPRTRNESVALAAALVATAVAVSVYGFYQVGVELPELQRRYLANSEEALRIVGIAPGSPQQKIFENRLLQSQEPYATFALANSLAGFLVGPLVLMLAMVSETLTRRDPKVSRLGAIAFALPPLLALLYCLVLTKSRSAFVGLAAAMIVIAWRGWCRVSSKTRLFAFAALVLVLASLGGVAYATGRLDKEVLTESGKSFRYRRQYWVGTWSAINESPKAYWRGFGPGNFQAAYLRHKLPDASEEIKDPHNLFLEVWSTAGAWAALALVASLLLTLNAILLPPKRTPDFHTEPALLAEQRRPADPSAPPPSPRWLILSALGGWVLVLLVGQMNLFSGGEFERWLILGLAWILAIAFGFPLWHRQPLEPAFLAAAALAVIVNLLAAGGISIPTVALTLWTLLALGLNLRDDRLCSRLRGPFGRFPAFGAAAALAALIGTFVGQIIPHWKAEAAIADAEEAIRARPPAFERAESAYGRAKDADPLSPRPWLALAALEYRIWSDRGGKHDDLRWKKIPIEMYKAVEPPRPADSWVTHRERAQITGLILRQLGGNLAPLEITRYRGNIVEASRKAVLLYPSNSSLRSRLAEASADIGMIPDALQEGREALRLDKLTPHEDKKLDPAIRQWLESKIPEWEKSAAQPELIAKPKPR